MFTINKTEERARKETIVLIVAGMVLVGIIVLISRGESWFTATAWARVSVIQWVAAGVILIIAVALQYYFLMLLRYSAWKYVLWLLPAVWLYNNGMVGIQRLFDSEAGVALTGWIPVTDLLGWLMAMVFWPLFIVGGAITAIIDSSGFIFTQPCQYARLALDMAGVGTGDIIGHVLNYLGTYWDLISDSFVRQVASEYSRSRSFWDFSLSGAFGLPHWLFNLGYGTGCLAA